MPVTPVDDTVDGPSFVRRLVLGSITGFALFHGLKHLTLAIGIYVAGTAVLSPEGVLGLLVAATLGASVVAGTINRRAELTGFLIGFAAAVICLGAELAKGVSLPQEWLIGVTTSLAIVGAVGGLAGKLMIPPAPTIPKFGRVDARILSKVQRSPITLVWWQIAVGAMLVVVGTTFSDPIRNVLSQVLVGHGGAGGSSALLTWQISVLCTILGGAVAGANTRSGFMQGLVSGIIAGSGAVVATIVRGAEGSRLVEFWVDQLGEGFAGPPSFVVLGITVCVGTTLGGWLGSHLMPPRGR